MKTVWFLVGNGGMDYEDSTIGDYIAAAVVHPDTLQSGRGGHVSENSCATMAWRPSYIFNFP